MPTPDGSMIKSLTPKSSISSKAFSKSPCNEQQIQPLLISLIFSAESKKEPSTPISPNSFSKSIGLTNFFYFNNF